jgi:hypothetical protein
MNGLLSQWWARAAIVGGLTWLAYKYLPVGSVGKTVVLAVGGVAAAGIVAGSIPMVGMALAGRLPLPAAATT